VTVSDPWDFVTHAGSNVFVADVHEGGDGHGPVLLRLSEPVRWHGDDWHWFVATRTPGASFSLHGVTEPQATTDDWQNAPDAWRGQSPVARADLG
jgi:hypothetical protein